jgi:hypothetical protein
LQKEFKLVEQWAGYFTDHVANLAAASREGTEPAIAFGREAFSIAQRANQSSAATAVNQMATRSATGSNTLAAVVRDKQEFSAARREKESAFVTALSKLGDQRDGAGIDALRNEITNLDGRIAAAAARLDREFPKYAAFANPKPLAVEELQQLLRGNEALAFFLVGDGESYVFALTRDSFKWRTILIGAKDLVAKIANLRRGLDVDALHRTHRTHRVAD